MTPEASISLWFRLLRERGECMDFTICRRHARTGELKENEFFHGDVDGISAILRLVQEDGETELYLPQLPPRPFPPAAFVWLSFFRYLARLPFRSPPWTLPPTGWAPIPGNPERPTARAFAVLDEAQTKKVWENAKALGVGRMAYLLHHLDRAVLPWLAESPHPRHWLLPVHLRPNLDLTQPAQGNMTGFADAAIRDRDDPVTLERQLRRVFNRGDHYGGWRGVALGQVLGENLLRKVVGLNDRLQVRTGVFTYLGNWNSRSGSAFDWFGYPPVLRAQPFGAMSSSLDGRQVLTVLMHPSLTRSPDTAREALERWVQGLTAGG